MVNYVKTDLAHVTVKAWKLHSGKAGLVGGTLLIYLCVEGTRRYYWWVTIASLLKPLLHDRNLAGFALTDTGRNNKQRPYFRRHLLSEWLGFDISEEAASLLLRAWVLPWHMLGLFWEKLQQELFKINGCLNVWCAASTQKRPHQTSPLARWPFTSLRASTEEVYSTAHVPDVRPAVFIAHCECPSRAQPYGRGIFW